MTKREAFVLPFWESIASWAAATLLPVLAGLSAVLAARRVVSAKHLDAFGLGVFLLFFVDTVSGSANLDVNAGFSGGFQQVGIFFLFAAGLVVFFVVDGRSSSGRPFGGSGLGLPVIVAVALGIHGLGEGAAFGATAYLTSSTSLLGAFGGLESGVAYALHKALEPMMAGAFYVSCVGTGETRMRPARDIALLGLAFSVPSLIGAVGGYYLTVDTAYLFAAGAGAAVYAAVRLSGQLFRSWGSSEPRVALSVAVSLLAGVTCVYLASLLHA